MAAFGADLRRREHHLRRADGQRPEQRDAGHGGTANPAPLTILAGGLNITGSGSSIFNGGVTVNGNTVLGDSRTLVFGGNNTFNGDVLFDNPNTVNFSGTTSVSGGVTINRGIVDIPGGTDTTSITVNGGALTMGTKTDGSSNIPISISGAAACFH